MSFFTQAKYIASAAELSQFPESLTWEFVVVGRSNVGKSSFINRITGHSNLAYVGKQPGKTRLINFFKIADGYLVDVPGYGYAQRSQIELKRYGRLMEDYFEHRNISAVVMLIDSRHPLSKDDVEMLEYLKENKLNILLIANKLDKLTQSELAQARKRLKETGVPVLFFSALKNTGLEAIQNWITKQIGQE